MDKIIPHVEGARRFVAEKIGRRPKVEASRGQEQQIGIRRADDTRRSEAAAAVVREELSAATPKPSTISERERVLLGDFASDGILEGNKLKVPDAIAREVSDVAKDFKRGRPYYKILANPFYFAKGNRTATEYDSPFARNRSTQTDIRELSDGRKVFLIDPRGSTLHRTLDTIARRAMGHGARKVAVREWKGLMDEKSEIPVLPSGDSKVAVGPHIRNVNGVDFWGNNKEINEGKGFPEEFRWAGDADLEVKLQVGEEAMRVAHDVHSRGKSWGEMATHNSLVVQQPDGKITVVPADTEVEYDQKMPETEKKARDIFDLTVTIAGGVNKSEGVTGEGYDAVVSRLFGAYENKAVIEKVGELAKPLNWFRRTILYPLYEGPRMNMLPYDQYVQIKQAMQKAAAPQQENAEQV